MAVRIGFIGTGGIAQMHMRNLQRISDAQVVGMFDVAPDRAQAAAAMFAGCRAYDSYQALLDQAALDAVYVCVPPFAHDRQELDAAAAAIEQAAVQASCETRLLVGQQAAAFTAAALPLCRRV